MAPDPVARLPRVRGPSPAAVALPVSPTLPPVATPVLALVLVVPGRRSNHELLLLQAMHLPAAVVQVGAVRHAITHGERYERDILFYVYYRCAWAYVTGLATLPDLPTRF